MKKINLLLLTLMFGFSAAHATKHIITQSDFTFTPNLITVNVGDTIHWAWTSGSHTTTSKTIPAGALSWDSPLSSANPTYEYVVTLPGVYEYKCTLHEFMGMTGIFQTNTSTGTAEYLTENAQSIICNGYAGGTRIFSQSEFSYNGIIRIYDISGKIVYDASASFGAGNYELLITDASLRKGLYILQIITDQKKRLSAKYFVQ
jgi:plastocyanin